MTSQETIHSLNREEIEGNNIKNKYFLDNLKSHHSKMKKSSSNVESTLKSNDHHPHKNIVLFPDVAISNLLENQTSISKSKSTLQFDTDKSLKHIQNLKNNNQFHASTSDDLDLNENKNNTDISFTNINSNDENLFQNDKFSPNDSFDKTETSIESDQSDDKIEKGVNEKNEISNFELDKNVEEFLDAQTHIELISKSGHHSRRKFTPDNLFEISFSTGKGVAKSKRNLVWFLFGLKGDFSISILVNDLNIIKIHRHVKFRLSETTNIYSNKKFIGKIKHKILVNLGIRKLYKIYDPSGNLLLNVFSPMLHPRSFFAQDLNGNILAKIYKYWDNINYDTKNIKKIEMIFMDECLSIYKALLIALLLVISLSHF